MWFVVCFIVVFVGCEFGLCYGIWVWFYWLSLYFVGFLVFGFCCYYEVVGFGGFGFGLGVRACVVSFMCLGLFLIGLSCIVVV